MPLSRQGDCRAAARQRCQWKPKECQKFTARFDPRAILRHRAQGKTSTPGYDPLVSLRLRAAAIFALHAIVFVALAAWSWLKWLDPIIDSGRELYVPWAITRGHVLYRDIASLFGPLSPYVNALWFRLFGDSLLTLAFCNLAILAALVAGIYHIVRTATDRLTATAAGLTTLLLFGFSQYVGVGNYNFVTPYSHEATHGLALCVAFVLCLYLHIAGGRKIFAALAGLCFGLVMLTKPDTSLGVIAAAVPGWIGAWWLGGETRAHLQRGLPAFIIGAIVPPLFFLIYFASKMPLALAMRGVAGAWATTFVPGIANNYFYQRVSGLDEPWLNVARMVLIFLGLVVYFAVLAVACRTRGPGDARTPWVKRLQQLVLLGLGVMYAQRGMSFFALPLTSLLALSVFVVMFARTRTTDRQEALKLLLLIMWSALSLALLAKIALAARIVHYGFYLSIPATVTAIVLICGTIPRALDRRASPSAGWTFRTVSVCLLAATIVPYVLHCATWYVTRVVPIGFGADRFWASNAPVFSQAAVVQETLDDLQTRIGPESRIAVLPEGAMVNYQLRRETPLRIINVMPPEIMAFGEDDVLRSLEAQPPQFVVVMHRDMKEYAYPVFGTDPRYGQRTMTWVHAHYRVVRVIGHDRTDPSIPAVQIFERTSP
jgi:hypothetical protein